VDHGLAPDDGFRDRVGVEQITATGSAPAASSTAEASGRRLTARTSWPAVRRRGPSPVRRTPVSPAALAAGAVWIQEAIAMKVFLTGATGVAGRATVPALLTAGHDVRAVSRRPEASAVLEAAGAEPVAVDLFDADAVAKAVVGSEAVVHLATNVPEMSKAGRPKGWEQHNRLRVEATANLVAAGTRHRPRHGS